MFFTGIPEKYYLGQILDLTIFLAGTDEVNACMQGEASVVRISGRNPGDEKNNAHKKGIGVKFNQPFDFKRSGN
jgi:hypothetical protein